MRFRSSDLPSTASPSFPALKAAAFWFALMAAGCGGGGGSAPAALDTETQGTGGTSFTITSDDYGVQKPTYLAATKGSNGLTLRAAIASSMTDVEFRTVARIDIAHPAQVAAGASYSLGGTDAGLPSFPGTLHVFNGHPSTMLRTTGGTIAFTSYGTNPGEPVSGSFRATILDENTAPAASYTIAATFSYRTGEYGPILPAPVPVPPEASSIYSSRCASCHTLGVSDATSGTAPDLALKGGHLEALFSPGRAGHHGVTLAAEEVSALKVLLNAN